MYGKPMLYVDQWGKATWARTVKELCERLGYSTARTMYRDKKGGPPVRVGYVVGPHWCDRFQPLELPV